MNNEKKFPTRKDMTYWIIILILFMVGSFTVYYGSNKDMVSHIGFGGTIVSILLAVIAIIYSFYQSSTYESTTHKLDSSAQKIEEATKQLSNVSEMRNLLENFKDEVREISFNIKELEEINNSIGSGVDSIRESFEDTRQDIFRAINSNPRSVDMNDIELSDEFFEKSLKDIGQLPLFALVLCNEATKKKISKINSKKWIGYFVDQTTNLREENRITELKKRFSYLYDGIIAAFNQLGIINAEYIDGDDLRINDVNEKLSHAIDNKIRDLKDIEDQKFYQLLTSINTRLSDRDYD
ncbi:hypothetical protein [Priestia endophytica]|uniref:hypothetical protein n=1 Tax=Priestia endophytica TaxID=135735 RepID=UPI000F549405|nr:hypothetical protein [Priestia endophytica]RPK08297.1 hypothetical protein FH5_04927 [Priestia endophytica]